MSETLPGAGYEVDEREIVGMLQKQQLENTQQFHAQRQRRDEALGKWEIEHDEHIDRLIFTIMGYRHDVKKHEWVRDKNSKVIINRAGISYIKSSLTTYFYKAVELGNNSHDEIADRTLNLCSAIATEFFIHRESYGIPDWPTYELICELIEGSVKTVFNKSKDGWLMEKRISMITVNSLMTDRQDQKRSGGIVSNIKETFGLNT